MQNRTSVGIRLVEGEPDFLEWFATHHPEEAKMLFNRYLRHIIYLRRTNRGKTDTRRPRP